MSLMTLVEILLFIVGCAFGALWFSVIILPIFYGLPRSLCWIARKTLKSKAVLFYLGTFALWTAIFIGTAYVLVEFLPGVARYVYNSSGFHYGQLLGVIGSLIRAFSKSGRKHLRDDFDAAMVKYKTDNFMRATIQKLAVKRSDSVKSGPVLIEEVEKRRAEVPTDREKEAIKEIIGKCEIDYHIDASMFGSEADFYVFLHLEVRHYAKKERIDFEKAKEAYISWAKNCHPAEYDRVKTPTDYNKQRLEYMITKCKKIKISLESLQKIMQMLEGDWNQ